MTETNRIEFKSQFNEGVDIEKEVIAFLNYNEGGLLYIGIDKDGKTVGVIDLDGDMLKIKDRIKNNVSPSAMGLFDVVSEKRDEKDVIKIIIASGSEKPYFKKKYGMTERGCFVRVGTAAEPMSQAMIDKLFAGRTRNSIGKIKSHRQDLSFEQIRIYYEEKGKSLNKQFKKNLEFVTEKGDLNYAAYLLADENNVSIKVAKYKGFDRAILEENNEYGYCSLVKATKSVLDKVELENKTLSTITSKERKDIRIWNPIALREGIINAFVHNDYTREIPPKFEIFEDRIEITSIGSLPDGLSEHEFFEGYSIPRNKELMRVFKDLELVEQLGSGIPRILQSYDKSCFKFSENFLRMSFPKAEISNQVGNQVSNEAGNQVLKKSRDFDSLVDRIAQLMKDPLEKLSENQIKSYVEEVKLLDDSVFKILEFCLKPKKKKEILVDCLQLSNQTKNFKNHIFPLLEMGLLQLTIKDRPTSQHQKYFLTNKGKVFLYIYQHGQSQI